MKRDTIRCLTGMLLVVLSILGLVACQQVPSSPMVYYGLIEAIEDKAGRHYTPQRDQTPVFELRLRVPPPATGAVVPKSADAAPRARKSRHLKLLVAEMYDPRTFGAAGDTVSFLYAGDLPVSGELWMNQLSGYRVTQDREPAPWVELTLPNETDGNQDE